MSIHCACAGTNHCPSISSGGISDADVGPESSLTADGLARHARSQIQSEMGIEGPMVLDEFGNYRGARAQFARALKSNLLGQGTILPQHLDGVRDAASGKRPAR